jgi:hypothetical protein
VTRRFSRVAAAFAAAQPCSLHGCPQSAGGWQAEVWTLCKRRRCERRGRAAHWPGVHGRAHNFWPHSPECWCELASSRTHLLCSRARMQADHERGCMVIGCTTVGNIATQLPATKQFLGCTFFRSNARLVIKTTFTFALLIHFYHSTEFRLDLHFHCLYCNNKDNRDEKMLDYVTVQND